MDAYASRNIGGLVPRGALCTMRDINPQVQVSADGCTVWVHGEDGSTVGRFAKRFGMDVHTTVTEQLGGACQCLHCTHAPATVQDWQLFCELMHRHYGIDLDAGLVEFSTSPHPL